MTIYRFLTAAFLVVVFACTPPEQTKTADAAPETLPQEENPTVSKKKVPPYVGKLEAAHKSDAFRAKKAVKFDIILMFGGKERLNGSVTALTNSTKARVDYKDGSRLIYEGDKVYAVDAENASGKRFSAYTWPYFFLFPYKLSDEGTQWAAYTPSTLNDKPYLAQKLTFEAGTGDDPNDWYITYANPESNLIEVAAYIVTAGKTQKEAEKDPHAVSYSDYQEVAGIPIAHAWKFWGWTAEAGLTKQLGEATLTNVQFMNDVPTDFFAKPAGYVEL